MAVAGIVPEVVAVIDTSPLVTSAVGTKESNSLINPWEFPCILFQPKVSTGPAVKKLPKDGNTVYLKITCVPGDTVNGP